MGYPVHLEVAYTPHYLTPPLYVTLWGSQNLYLSRAYIDESTVVDLRTSSGASCHHHSLLCRIPPWTLTPIHRLWILDIDIADVCIPTALNTSMVANIIYILSVVLCALFLPICCSNYTCVTSTVLIIASVMAHDYDSNNRNTCITSQSNISGTWVYVPYLHNIFPI